MGRLALVLLLAAGACTPMAWTRSDATAGQRDADWRSCREQAWREATWPPVRYWGGFGPYSFFDPFIARGYVGPYYSPFSDDRFADEARLTDFCMRAKGYALAPLTK